MILPRLITAIIGIPLVILTAYWGGIAFFILIVGVVLLSLREFYILTRQGNYQSQPLIGIIIGLLLLVSIFLNGTKIGIFCGNQGTPLILTLILIPVFAREMLRLTPNKIIEKLSITFFGAFLISWTLGHLILIRNLRPSGMLYIFFLFIVIWTLDTGAYVFGVRFGKHKLAQMVSPKKTIEGALGGVLTSILVSLAFRAIFLKEDFTIYETVIIGLVIAVVSQFSDLAESLIKRDVGVKDSSGLLPGHGGMLDRFDSFLFTAPLFYYYITIFKN